jgi:hypothetical protein
MKRGKNHIDEHLQDLEISFQELEQEYLRPFFSDKSNEVDLSSASQEIKTSRPTSPIEEKRLISQFLSTSCSCGENCQRLFTVSEVIESRENFRLMSWNEKHSFIIGKLQTFIRVSKQSVSARTIKLRERQKFDYFINADRPVCRTVFLFYHGESIDRLKRHQKYLTEIGTLPLSHGNTGKTPKHACKPKDKKNVKTFIENFVAIHGLPDPGRDLRAEKGRLKVYLPTLMNYMFVHRIYQKSMVLDNTNAVQHRTFRRLWIEHFPNIVFSKPKSDLCMTCEDNKKLINASIAYGDEDYKLECLMVAKEHLLAAKKERDYFRESIQLSKESYQQVLPDGKLSENKDFVMHYSWDFAQQLHIPYEDHQVGPIYFKSPRIAQLFGICCEALPQQVNYLIDEADFPGKGADVVISLLDHYFEHYGLKESHVLLTADNCVGQNKNNAVIQYLMYRVMTGQHKSITLSFMLVGHTKFSPDAYFGLIKKKYRRSKVYTYDHLVDVIDSSTTGNFNVTQTYRNNDGREKFHFRKWSSWLGKIFKELSGITNYQHFRIEADAPGEMNVKRSVDAEEETFFLLKKKTFKFDERSEKPPCFTSKGLSAERQWYLYDKIRLHIPSEMDKDVTAPKPEVTKPKEKKKKQRK